MPFEECSSSLPPFTPHEGFGDLHRTGGGPSHRKPYRNKNSPFRFDTERDPTQKRSEILSRVMYSKIRSCQVSVAIHRASCA